MIHEITDDLFDLPLSDYILTFDDGTEDHYQFWHKIKPIPTTKIFFIITDRIGTPGYLTLDQVKEIQSDPSVEIGGHSHQHGIYKDMSLSDVVANLKSDLALMIDWFKNNLGYVPNSFCYPYNEDYRDVYPAIVKSQGIKNCYGRGRIDVSTLSRS